MAEKIKVELRDCSHQPRSIPYCCFTASRLSEILGRIKNLGNEDFQNVYESAKSIDLPKDFQAALESEYKKRNG